MAVDFSALVLAPCQDTFSRPVTIDPVVSQPGKAPYTARGIVTSRQQDIAYENGEIISSQLTTLGIRAIEFAVPPTRGDGVTLSGDPYAGDYWVGDTYADAQGQQVLTLRRQNGA